MVTPRIEQRSIIHAPTAYYTEIYNHINTCKHFLYLKSLLNLPSNIYNLNEYTILPGVIFNTVEPVYNGHPRHLRNWPLNAGDRLIQDH